MRTECPACQTAFRVTAAVLRQAHGQVRCGDCGHVFDALDFLFEDPDDAAAVSDVAADRESAGANALLGSLDDLSGDDDVRIEDTGVEWRVLDVADADSEADTDAANSDDEPADAADSGWSVERPLDLTTVEDEDADDAAAFAEAGDVLAVGRAEDDSDNDAAASPDEQADAGDDAAFLDSHAGERGDPGRPAQDEYAADATDVDDEADTDDGTAGERDAEAADEDTLDQVTGDAPDEGQQMRFDDNTPIPNEFYESRNVDAESPGEAEPVAADGVDPDEQALRVSIETGTAADWQELLDEVDAAPGAEDDDATADDDSAVTPAEAQAADEEDADASAAQPASAAAEDEEEDESLVESIVMEGETVTELLERAEQANYDGILPPEFDDDTLIGAVPDDRKRIGTLGRVAGYAGILLLLLALAAQLVHANREMLATQPLFQQTVAPVYDALGLPVQPAWEVQGWQFEATSGNSDGTNESLTISSRISNRSNGALPYPLLLVSLTDRFDEVIGSRILTPREYLAGTSRPTRPVRPGGAFTAVVAVSAPSTAATGFKLNVCYPMSGARVRCAIEDFRD